MGRAADQKIIPALALVCLFSLALLVSCRDTTVSVACGSLHKVHSAFGVVNTARLSLGTVLELDGQTHAAVPVYTLKTGDDDIVLRHKADGLAMVSASDFAFSISPSVDAETKTAIESEIRSNTMFRLSEVRDQEIKNASDALNSDKDFVSLLRQKTDRDTHKLYVLVSSVVNVGRGELILRDAAASAGANAKDMGGATLRVTYSCQDALNGILEKAPLFFRFTTLAFDSENGTVQVLGPTVDLDNYSLAPLASLQ
jgi:hypothetical protein